MELGKNFFKGSISAISGKLHVRFSCVKYLLQNVIERVRHAIVGMLIKVNILRDRELVPAGTSKDGFLLSKTSIDGIICEFVDYSTSLIHALPTSEQKKLVLHTRDCHMTRHSVGGDGRSGRYLFPRVLFIPGDAAQDGNCRNFLNARKFGDVINKNGLKGYIATPNRSKIIFNEKQDSDHIVVNSVILEDRLETGYHASYESYEKNLRQFDGAAKAFAVLSRELVHEGLVDSPHATISQIIANFKKGKCVTALESLPNSSFIYIGAPTYTKKENGQYLLHLLNIDQLIDEKEFCRVFSEKDDGGISGVAHLVPSFLFFYKHSDLMLAELKKTGLSLTDNQKQFLRYCSNISKGLANMRLHPE